MKNKVLTRLKKSYKKRIKHLNKLFNDYSGVCLLTFIEQLSLLRDSLVLKAGAAATQDEAITALILATAEFEAYQIAEKDEDAETHWNKFWEFIKKYFEEWVFLNDTI